MYIGKASQIGARLDHYFGYGENGKCILKDKRVDDISYVQCYSCSQEEPYACLSLEEYLISEMNPKYNADYLEYVAPHAGSVDRNCAVYSLGVNADRSLPTRGAWIEIGHFGSRNRYGFGRSPRGERG